MLFVLHISECLLKAGFLQPNNSDKLCRKMYLKCCKIFQMHFNAFYVALDRRHTVLCFRNVPEMCRLKNHARKLCAICVFYGCNQECLLKAGFLQPNNSGNFCSEKLVSVLNFQSLNIPFLVCNLYPILI